jgi:hypothetical protein
MRGWEASDDAENAAVEAESTAAEARMKLDVG